MFISGVQKELQEERRAVKPFVEGDPLLCRYFRASLFEDLWNYDLRTNKHFTLKTSPLTREDLDDFVACYNPKNRHDRKPTWSEQAPDGSWRAYEYDEVVTRDKASLNIF